MRSIPIAEFPPAPVRWHSSLYSRLARNQWMLADQAMVSGMNFLTTTLLARMLGVHDFGVFSVFFVVLQYLNSIQLALVVSPMMSLAPQLPDTGEHHRFLSGMAGYQYLFSLGCCAATAFFFSAQLLHLLPQRTPRMETALLLPFMGTVLCFQVQDWFRRFCYVQDRGRSVFWNDVVSYVGQVASFCLLWRLGNITVQSAYYAIAVTSLAAYAAGIRGNNLLLSWRLTKEALARTRRAGASLLVASQFQWLGSQGLFLIVAAILGVSAASGIRAALALMGPVILLYQLLDNVIPVRAARVYAVGGEAKMLAYLRQAFTPLVVIVGIAVIIASILGRPIMSLVFGQAYGAFAPLVSWAGVYVWLGLVYRGLLYYHRTVGTTAVLARATLMCAILSVTTCVMLTRRFGSVGGMIALVMGQVLNLAIPLAWGWRAARNRTATT
jgi:O-antigen/teichoic acid export membrane protein